MANIYGHGGAVSSPSPATDNCPSYISGRRRKLWLDRISNWGPLALKSDALPTALCGLADQNVPKLFRMLPSY